MNKTVIDQTGAPRNLQFIRTITGVASSINKSAHVSYYESELVYHVNPPNCQWKYYEQKAIDVKQNGPTPKGTHAQAKLPKKCNQHGKNNNLNVSEKGCAVKLKRYFTLSWMSEREGNPKK